MRRIIAMLAALVLILAVVAWADNAGRIADLQARQKAIIVEINDRQVVVDTQQSAIQELKTEFVKNQGAIEELQRQDKAPPGGVGSR